MISSKDLYPRIYTLVKQVPAGYVTTYGEIARLVGTTARVVGFAMAALPHGHDVPWQRVINSKGRISRRSDGDDGDLQKLLLQSEGVRFNEQGKVDLEKHRCRFG